MKGTEDKRGEGRTLMRPTIVFFRRMNIANIGVDRYACALIRLCELKLSVNNMDSMRVYSTKIQNATERYRTNTVPSSGVMVCT